jgi:mitogen-activated protein kinase 1/3
MHLLTDVLAIVALSTPSPPCAEKVAIKKISPMCEDVWDAKHTLRELRLMRLLDYHPNVISLVGLSASEDSLYIVMELMDSDLHKIVQSKQKLGESHLKVIWTQILDGVSAMHRNNVFHRDLKPGNILVGRDCQVRITDFGLARSINQNDDIDSSNPASAMTEYVVTRWYR